MQINSTSSEQTEQIAEKIGNNLTGGELIELVSDLGGGKTTFARGLARGAGSSDVVTSPSFTISKVYQTPNFELHHFDFYRLPEAGIIANELAEIVDDPEVVAVVEWADVIKHILPENRLTIEIHKTPEGDRKLVLHYPENLKYLVRGLQ